MTCYCPTCNAPQTIKQYKEGARRAALDAAGHEYAAHVLKATGVDITKREEAPVAHTTESGYDEATLDMLARAGLPLATANKSARATAGDPSWDRLLAVHAAAAAGDPAAMSAWAAFEGLDPGAARMVPEVVKMRRPKTTRALNKVVTPTAFASGGVFEPDAQRQPRTEWAYVPRKVAEKRARRAYEDGEDDDLSFNEFMASLGKASGGACYR